MKRQIMIYALLTLCGFITVFCVYCFFQNKAVIIFIISILALYSAAISIVLVIITKKNRLFRQELTSLLQRDTNRTKDQFGKNDLSDDGLLHYIDLRTKDTSLNEILKTEAELHALQNQINPHFLYNTLEIIRSRALIKGCDDVANMAEALALQFRYCINNPGELTTLRKELDNVHNYFLIQHYRYGDRFTYSEMINDEDDRIFNCNIPIMTLQPIIENALMHGINSKISGGIITLRALISGERLHIYVEDNGVGIKDDDLKRMRAVLQNEHPSEHNKAQGNKSLGIALKNVNERIKFYFGPNYGVDITSIINVGTTVRVTLPLEPL